MILSAVVIFQYSQKVDGKVADIYQSGVLVRSVSLDQDTVFTIESSNGGYNTIQVKDGAISVIEASCPDQICVHQGAISDGTAPVVCLPNQLVIQIKASSDDQADAAVG